MSELTQRRKGREGKDKAESNTPRFSLSLDYPLCSWALVFARAIRRAMHSPAPLCFP